MLETTVDWAALDVGRLTVVVAIVVGQRKVCGDQERSQKGSFAMAELVVVG